MIEATINIATSAEHTKLDEHATVPLHEWILRRVRVRAKRRVAWLKYVWARAGGPENRDDNAEIDAYLDNIDDPVAESEWLQQDKSVQQWNEELKKIESTLTADKDSRLSLLARNFGLTPAEKDLVQACLALFLDPHLGRIYAYLQDHNARTYVTAPMVARLFGHGQFLPVSAESPIIRWGIVQEIDMGRGEAPRIECDPFIRTWLLGITDMDDHLNGISQPQPVYLGLPHWQVNDTAATILKMLRADTSRLLRVIIAGTEGSGRKSFAASICRRLGFELLTVQSDRIEEVNWIQTYTRIQRLAFLNSQVILWQGNAALERQWPNHIPPFQLQFVVCNTDESPLPDKRMTDYKIEMPSIPLQEAHLLWQKFIPASAQWNEAEFLQLLLRQPARIGQIALAAKKQVTTIPAASEVLRSGSRERLGKLAQQLTSSFKWDDLVIPGWLRENLTDFTFEATERGFVWERSETKRLFPQGRGLIALFTGVPGTGKTMAAQVIANSLHLDLFRIDLSAIVSKYVGETSKNIERILSRARSMDAVLLFDEADALFGKRTEIKDAHDRFANTDTNYLLQAIEQYPGIAILATNRKANIDPGFIRRVRYVLEFPKPDVQQRLQMWKLLMSELVGKEAMDTLQKDLPRLAEMMELTGAQIKMAILSAIFMARRDRTTVTVTHLLRGLERELMKEGRGLEKEAQAMMKT